MNLQSKIQDLYCRMKSMRFLTLLIIWGFMVDDMLRLYRNLAMELNVKDSFAILPFIQNDDFFMKVVLLSVLCFYSNAPFMERNELYFVQRIGKKRWGSRNIFYIFGSSILLAVILVLLSILLNFPAVDFSNSWGSLYRTVSVYGMEKYQIPLIVDTKVMSAFTPYQMIGHVILMDILAFAVIGMLLYTLSLYVRRVGAYIVTILLIFFSTMVNYLDAGAKLGLIYFSPFSWENVGNWRYGYDLSKPNFVYIYVGYFLILFLLVVAGQRQIQRIDWISREE